MIPITTILVPFDFSEPSKKALSYGLTLAGQFDATLIIAHIVSESSALAYTFPTEAPRVEKEQYDKAVQEIDRLLATEHAATARLDLRKIIKVGSIEAELLRIVRDDRVDLVVIGTHGRRPPERWFIGSVAEHMLRKIPVPILTVSHVQPEKYTIGLVSLHRILYATDLAEPSNAAVQYAVEIARTSAGHLTVVHVIDPASTGQPLFLYAGGQPDLLSSDLKSRLDNFITKEVPSDVHVESIVVEGKPFEEILSLADSRDTDIIILNLQSKGIFERGFLGSTAERVIRLAHVPVLCIPASFNEAGEPGQAVNRS